MAETVSGDIDDAEIESGGEAEESRRPNPKDRWRQNRGGQSAPQKRSKKRRRERISFASKWSIIGAQLLISVMSAIFSFISFIGAGLSTTVIGAAAGMPLLIFSYVGGSIIQLLWSFVFGTWTLLLWIKSEDSLFLNRMKISATLYIGWIVTLLASFIPVIGSIFQLLFIFVNTLALYLFIESVQREDREYNKKHKL